MHFVGNARSSRNPSGAIAHARPPARGITCVKLGAKVSCHWFRLVPFRSPLLRESSRLFVTPRPLLTTCDKESAYTLFIFLRVLRCFTSPSSHPLPMYSVVRIIVLHTTGFPHSDISGSKVACHLPETYRRLPRPSSAPRCQVIHRTPFRASSIQSANTLLDPDGDHMNTYLQ